MGSDGTMTSGILRGIEDGWFTGEIAEAAFQYQQKLEKGEKKVVGVNVHTASDEPELEILRVSGDVETDQVAALGARKAARDDAAVRSALAAMLDAARSGANLVPPMLAAARVEATLGEICGVLRDEWGAYTEPARF
jgi:methylmalonyl-CoA mutase N-terminal domain/subunit